MESFPRESHYNEDSISESQFHQLMLHFELPQYHNWICSVSTSTRLSIFSFLLSSLCRTTYISYIRLVDFCSCQAWHTSEWYCFKFQLLTAKPFVGWLNHCFGPGCVRTEMVARVSYGLLLASTPVQCFEQEHPELSVLKIEWNETQKEVTHSYKSCTVATFSFCHWHLTWTSKHRPHDLKPVEVTIYIVETFKQFHVANVVCWPPGAPWWQLFEAFCKQNVTRAARD